MKNLQLLIKELINRDAEDSCIEFKANNSDPNEIGEYISALSNSATYNDQQYAYLVWGVDNDTHKLTDTKFNYRIKKGEGNEDLEPWLRRLLSDNANFEFDETYLDEKKVVVLIIYKALGKIVTFKGQEYIRVGSYKKKLKDYPAMESTLWAKINGAKFEKLSAKTDLNIEEALTLIDYPIYFDMCGIQLPVSVENITHYLIEDNLLRKQDNGLFTITNLGALLFAKRIASF
jgi:predicted HTH transcriptional regulator